MEENIKRLGNKNYRAVEFKPCNSSDKAGDHVHLNWENAEVLSGL